MKIFKFIVIMYYYSKARNYASDENFLEALDVLYKIPENWDKPFFYYLLKAYSYERLYKTEQSLINYDLAKHSIINNKKLNADDKEYLYSYIDYGYSHIYRLKEEYKISSEFILSAETHVFLKEKVHSFIKNDFPFIR